MLGEKRENFRGSEKMRTSSHQDENERQQKKRLTVKYIQHQSSIKHVTRKFQEVSHHSHAK